jgi:putative transposase
MSICCCQCRLIYQISKFGSVSERKSSYKLLQDDRMSGKQFCGCHLWERGYFVATSGNVTDEVIIEYIKNQKEPVEGNDEFTIVTS